MRKRLARLSSMFRWTVVALILASGSARAADCGLGLAPPAVNVAIAATEHVKAGSATEVRWSSIAPDKRRCELCTLSRFNDRREGPFRGRRISRDATRRQRSLRHCRGYGQDARIHPASRPASDRIRSLQDQVLHGGSQLLDLDGRRGRKRERSLAEHAAGHCSRGHALARRSRDRHPRHRGQRLVHARNRQFGRKDRTSEEDHRLQLG